MEVGIQMRLSVFSRARLEWQLKGHAQGLPAERSRRQTATGRINQLLLALQVLELGQDKGPSVTSAGVFVPKPGRTSVDG